MRSLVSSRFFFAVRIETNENNEEIISKNATPDVNSSTITFSALLVKCNEVIINRQNPSRFAAVPKICCDVLFGIFQKLSIIFQSQFAQLFFLCYFKLFPLKTPFPVSTWCSRRVHSCSGIQFQNILHRENSSFCH